MKHLIALLSGCLISAPLCALTVDGNTATFTNEELAQCENEGGCLHITRKQLNEAFEAAVVKGFERGAHSCRNWT